MLHHIKLWVFDLAYYGALWLLMAAATIIAVKGISCLWHVIFI